MDFQSGIMKVLVIKIALINLWLPLTSTRGELDYEYGYGASEVEREPIAYISVALKLNIMLLLSCQVLSVSCGGLGYFLSADPQSERTRK